MNTPIQGTLFDGETLAGRPVQLVVSAGRLHDADLAGLVDAPLADLRISDRLGDVPRFLYLPNGRTVATPDNDAVDTLLASQSRGRLVALIHALERHHQAAAAATLLLVATVAFTIWWGLPVLARHAAMAVPESIEKQAGRVSQTTLERIMGRSDLYNSERDRVQAQLDRLLKAGGITQKPTLLFKSMGGTFPNAFALPGGILVVSDELVRLAEHDEEVAAVLAHEIGHWQHRHGMQSVLRSSTALLVVSTITGDLSTLTTFAGTIPFVLLQRGYSREFETEADAYALDLMRRANIDPRHFRSILRRLEASRSRTNRDFTYLSTHPDTDARVRALGRLPPEPPAPDPKSRSARPATVAYDATMTPPRALFRTAPAHPVGHKGVPTQGTATVAFEIDERGHPRNARIVKSTHRAFESPAMDAILQWRFEPAKKDGRAVTFRAIQVLHFNAYAAPTLPPDAPLTPDQSLPE